MAQDPNILNFDDVVSRVREFQVKSAGETDPNEMGTKSIPQADQVDDTKRNSNSSHEGEKLEDKDTQPHSTGKHKVDTDDGTVKDDAACGGDPTKPLSKIAQRANNILERVKSETDYKPAKEASKEDKQEKPEDTKEANTEVAQDMTADPEFLFKLAGTIIETEGGIEAVEGVLRKAAGVEAANEIIEKATQAYTDLVEQGYADIEQEKQAALAYEEELYKQAAYEQAAIENYLGETLKEASEEDLDAIAKMAEVHYQNLASTDDDGLKVAYMQGVEDAAVMGDAEDPAAAELAGEGEVNDEEVLAMIMQMIESGELPEEEAMALIEALEGGAGAEGAEEAPMPEEGMIAEASDKGEITGGALFNKLVSNK